MRNGLFLRAETRFNRAWRHPATAGVNLRFNNYALAATPAFSFGAWISLNALADLSTTGSTLFSFGSAGTNSFFMNLTRSGAGASTFYLQAFGRAASAGSTTSFSATSQVHDIVPNKRILVGASFLYNSATPAASTLTLVKDRYLVTGSWDGVNGLPTGTNPFLIGNRVGITQPMPADFGECFLVNRFLNRQEWLRIYNGGIGSDYVRELGRYDAQAIHLLLDDALTDSSGNAISVAQYANVTVASTPSGTPTYVNFPTV